MRLVKITMCITYSYFPRTKLSQTVLTICPGSSMHKNQLVTIEIIASLIQAYREFPSTSLPVLLWSWSLYLWFIYGAVFSLNRNQRSLISKVLPIG